MKGANGNCPLRYRVISRKSRSSERQQTWKVTLRPYLKRIRSAITKKLLQKSGIQCKQRLVQRAKFRCIEPTVDIKRTLKNSIQQ